MPSRRNRSQIYVDILRSIQNGKGKLKKTHIVYKANLTHSRLDKYLNFLLLDGLLEEKKVNKHHFYFITEKGTKFLSEVNKFKQISKAFGISF